MAHYHFNIFNGMGFVPEEEGRELPDLETARTEALKDIRSIVSEEVLHGRLDLAGRLEIVDGARKLLLTIGFAEALKAGR